MSQTSPETDRLRAEVRLLREELRCLRLRVDQCEDSLEEVRTSERASAVEPSSISLASAVSVHSTVSQPPGPSLGSYTVVSSEPGPSFQPSVSSAARVEPGKPTWEFREQVAREIGAFLGRGVAGEKLGTSGRDKLAQIQNRVYIIVRDFEGRWYTNPVKVTQSFATCRQFCKRGSFCGEALFVGVPSIREAKIAVSEAGLTWPQDIQ